MIGYRRLPQLIVLIFGTAGAAALAETPAGPSGKEQPLLVGWATTDITPPRPVSLVGQLHKRISTGVLDPLTATVLALETRGSGGEKEQAIMVSCDLILIERVVQKRLQEKTGAELPDFDGRKLFASATHTHTGPGLSDDTFKDLYDVSKDTGVMKASEYADFFVDRVSKAVVEAWRNRKPGGMSWALGYAAVGFNRRAHYFDGTSSMYGGTNVAKFSNIEGPDDHAVDLVMFWGPEAKLTGLIVNVSCTSQVSENLNVVSADFWHEVREELRRRHAPDLFIFPQCGAAGDQSPRLLYRNRAEQAMDARRGLSRRQEIARRIANAVDDVLPLAKADIKAGVVFRHTVASVDIPEHPSAVRPVFQADSVHPIEFHVLRLGDVAIGTSPFELYLDYGTRIEARSRAVLTMLVQLSCSFSGYLPTERAVKGGGYSADKFIVGPEGGQVLVEETVRQINAWFP